MLCRNSTSTRIGSHKIVLCWYYLAHVILGGIKYYKIHMWYTKGMKLLIISFLCQWKWIYGQTILHSHLNLDFYHIRTTKGF